MTKSAGSRLERRERGGPQGEGAGAPSTKSAGSRLERRERGGPQGEGAGAPSTSPGGVDAAYFSSLNAPFDFAEAQRRVRLSVSPKSVS
jgi:hypothetical protein